MGDKQRWSDPANDGQVSYVKVGTRFTAIIALLAIAAIVKIAIKNDWIDALRYITGY